MLRTEPGVPVADGLSDDPAGWPWATEPYRLWSLWDMRRFFGAAFSTAFVGLEIVQAEALRMEIAEEGEAEWREMMLGRLRDMANECRAAKFTRLADRCATLMQTAPSMDPPTVCHMLRDLLADIQRELIRHMYFLIPEERKAWYHQDDRPLFGEAVATAIPDTTSEIAEAGRCLALARWTACVFHLMRATERALHKWSRDFGLALQMPLEQANWQEILNAADRKLKEIGQLPRSPQREADLQYFGETAAHFRAIRDAWRNHVAHSKVTYDERGALTVLEHVRTFMVKLATRP